jgi:hypothetical protein
MVEDFELIQFRLYVPFRDCHRGIGSEPAEVSPTCTVCIWGVGTNGSHQAGPGNRSLTQLGGTVTRLIFTFPNYTSGTDGTNNPIVHAGNVYVPYDDWHRDEAVPRQLRKSTDPRAYGESFAIRIAIRPTSVAYL